ncbi:DUF3489 domain-containing protein [Sneathiella sp. HT1-7]|uniref:DUF3489 domain-containing protein n=1 Tax=Sneathiella sp. HT1-7 TaxID=2887192 RepID=UPI001D147CF7|nr:DUF3489 domain-containing protein [Sneathiella sp. HT1-7]
MTSQTPNSSNRKQGKANNPAACKARTTTPSKLDRMISHLRQKEGATLDELCTATGWQAHSVRGAIAGTLKKKGHAITSEKIDGVRRYRIGDPQ